ncbi:hypothetical protein ACN47E_002122 [Coniothyrium glycines]
MACAKRVDVHILVSFFFLFVGHVQTQTAAWLCPAPLSSQERNNTANWTLKLGSVRTLRWESSLPSAKIELFQDTGQTANGGAIKWFPIFTINDISGETGEYNWTVNANDFDLSRSVVFYLGLTISQRDGSESRFVTSTYVNITTDDTNPICVPPSTTSTSSSVASSSPSATVSDASSSSPVQASSSGLSSGAIAGVGVGCALAGAAVLAALGWWFFRRRRQAVQYTPAAHSDTEPADKYSYRVEADADAQALPVEADAGVPVQQSRTKDGTRYELSS